MSKNMYEIQSEIEELAIAIQDVDESNKEHYNKLLEQAITQALLKTDGYVYIIQELEEKANMLKATAKVIEEKANKMKIKAMIHDNKIKRMKETLCKTMSMLDKDNLYGDLYKIIKMKASPKLIITDEKLIPDKYKETKIIINKKEILKEIKETPIKGCHTEQTEYIRIY